MDQRDLALRQFVTAEATPLWRPFERRRLRIEALKAMLAPASEPEVRPMSVLPQHGQGDRTLFQRLREARGIEIVDAVVESLYDLAYADSRVSGFFRRYDRGRLEREFKKFLLYAMGHGKWDGPDLTEAHRNVHIRPQDFDIIAEHLNSALIGNDIPEDIRGEIMGLAASLKPKLVNAPA